MTVGVRLREERLRVGLSQPALATVAGVTKGAVVKWEKDAASPNAAALIAFADHGLDAVYILTGRRLAERLDAWEEHIKENLAELRRDLLEPARKRKQDESIEAADERIIQAAHSELRNMVAHDLSGLSSEIVEEAKALLDISASPQKLSEFRSIDFVQKHERRKEERELLAIWLQNWPYQPNDAVMKLLTEIALDYEVPPRFLVELTNEIWLDLQGRNQLSR